MRLINQENKRTNILPLLMVATFSLHLLTLLILMFHGSLLQRLNHKNKIPSLVQLVDGSTLTAEPKDNLERTPETIKRFVGETMTLMFTWSQQQPPKTVLQTGSQLIADNYQKKFESLITTLNPGNPYENISRGTETVLIIQRVSQPEQIEPGKWKVEIFANSLMFGTSDKLGKSTPFNKQILVRATNKQPTTSLDEPLPLNSAVHRLGQAELEVYNVCEIKDIKCSGN
jgi:hypothetical protein